MSLEKILPCKYCRDNYKNNIKKIKLNMNTMKNRLSVSKWLFDLHEEINTMLGKNSNLTYDEIRNRYEMFRARCINDTKGNKKKNNIKPKKEKGCVKPLYGVRSKCIINIVPKNKKCKTFKIDKKCRLVR